jgi:hypothetical protein
MNINKDKRLALQKIIYWLPRILSILFIAFISIFALDVFSEAQWFLALLVHLIPSYILIILTAVAWKHERVGGFIFIAIGFLVLVLSRFESPIISIPAVVIGALFVSRKYLSKT